MALWILAPDQTDTCCTCAELATVCSSCTSGEQACNCALVLPLFNAPMYSSYSAANNVITTCVDSNKRAFLGTGLNNTINSFTTSLVADTLTLACSTSIVDPDESLASNYMVASINLMSGASVSVTFTTSQTPPGDGTLHGQVNLYDCSGTWIGFGDESQIPGTFILTGSIPASAEYLISTYTPGLQSEVYFTTLSSSYSITSSDTLTVNPIYAKYDDLSYPAETNDPYILYANPKLNLPGRYLRNQTYGTLAAAQTAINTVENCIAYSPNDAGSFTWAGSAGSYTVHAETFASFFFLYPTFGAFMSINIPASTTVSVTYKIQCQDSIFESGRVLSVNAGSHDTRTSLSGSISVKDSGFWPYEQNNFTIEGSLNWTLPSAGQYYINVGYAGAGGSIPTPDKSTGDFTISIGGSPTTLFAQARYDKNAFFDPNACPAYLDC